MSYHRTNGIGDLYPGFEEDPVRAVTNILINRLGGGQYTSTQQTYSDLLDLLRDRGLSGKDIRFVSKELGELRKRAMDSDSAERETISKKAQVFIEGLPAPIQERKRLRSLESIAKANL